MILGVDGAAVALGWRIGLLGLEAEGGKGVASTLERSAPQAEQSSNPSLKSILCIVTESMPGILGESVIALMV
jgi:hypothetical protein